MQYPASPGEDTTNETLKNFTYHFRFIGLSDGRQDQTKHIVVERMKEIYKKLWGLVLGNESEDAFDIFLGEQMDGAGINNPPRFRPMVPRRGHSMYAT